MYNSIVVSKTILILFIYYVNVYSITSAYETNHDNTELFESFTPCDDNRVIVLQRQMGLSTNWKNTYNGSFSFDLWQYLSDRPRLTITLDNPAKLYLTDYDGRKIDVLSGVKKFHIIFDKTSSEIGTVNFWITAPEDAEFPNIVSVRLDDHELCYNPKLVSISE